MRMRVFLLVCWSGVAAMGSCLGQAGAGQAGMSKAEVTPGADAYAGEPLVIERYATIYTEAADGTGSKAIAGVMRVQADSALKQVAVLSVGFAAKSEHVQWEYARLTHRDGTKVETPVGEVQEVALPVTREAPFYSDLKELQLPLKDLRVGDRVEWKVKVVQTRAEAANEFWGQHSLIPGGVVLEERVELRVPKDKAVTVWHLKLAPAETVEGAEKVYRWQTSRTEPTVGERAEAAAALEKKRVRTPAEELDTREGKLADIAWTTFPNWAAVGAWYRGLSSERAVPDAAVKAKVAELTAGKTTEQEKVQAVYSYVAAQIHYIGVAFGTGRYQPHAADEVLANQYGDCKDKHTLLAGMLLALGLSPDAVLIGQGVRFNEAVPSPGAFNHLITRVSVAGTPVWLDTTAELAPFGMLTYLSRGHQALVIPAIGEARVETAPRALPFQAVEVMDAAGKLDAEGLSNSRLSLTFRGDAELLVRLMVRQLSPAQYDQLGQQVAANMGYGGTVSRVEVSRPEDTREPMRMSFDYQRSKAGDWANLKTIPQLMPLALPRVNENEPAVQSLELGVPRVELSKTAMTLPVGWQAEMPQAIHLKSEWATDDLTYRLEKGVMYAERRVEILKERVPVADLKAYDKFAAKAVDEQYVQLRPAAHTPGAGAASASQAEAKPGAAQDEKPEEMVERAYQAMLQNDLQTASTLLDRVKAINPEQPRLWGFYGDLAFRHGELTEAVADYQKELKLHPASVQIYFALMQSQLLLKHTGDVMESARRWAEAAPGDARPLSVLAGMQLEAGKDEEAARSAEAGLARVQDDQALADVLHGTLGKAEMKLGHQEKGRTLLVGVLEHTENPMTINNVAFDLVNAGLELPLCESKVKTALGVMEERSRDWTLDQAVPQLRADTGILQATWDTLGWAYFKEGKLELAERYVKASWLGRQTEEVGKHLAEIEAARGNRVEAAGTYRLAVASAPFYDALGGTLPQTAAQKEMLAKAAALSKAGAGGKTPSVQLQDLRRMPLGKSPAGAAPDGVVEYKVLLGPLGLMTEKPAGTKELAQAAELLVRARAAALFPEGEQGQLMYLVMLNCHGGTCEMVLMP